MRLSTLLGRFPAAGKWHFYHASVSAAVRTLRTGRGTTAAVPLRHTATPSFNLRQSMHFPPARVWPIEIVRFSERRSEERRLDCPSAHGPSACFAPARLPGLIDSAGDSCSPQQPTAWPSSSGPERAPTEGLDSALLPPPPRPPPPSRSSCRLSVRSTAIHTGRTPSRNSGLTRRAPGTVSLHRSVGWERR